MDQTDSNTSGKRPTGLIIGIAAIVVLTLVIVALFLPPFSLGQRLGAAGNSSETAAGDAAAEPPSEGETITTIAGADVPEGVTLSLSEGNAAVAMVDYSGFSAENSAALPEGLTAVSDVYTVDGSGTTPKGQIALALPSSAGDVRTLDLYGWNGSSWVFVPSQIDLNSQQIVSADATLPVALTMAQVAKPEESTVGTIVLPEQELPAEVTPHLSEVIAGTLTLDENGELSGELTAVPDGPYAKWALVTNVGPIVNQAVLSTLLGDEAAQQTNVDTAVAKVTDANLDGVLLHYQDVPAGQAAAFSTFVQKLADALDAQGKDLAVVLGTPTPAGSTWDTGGQDWRALGQTADVVYVQLPLNPQEYSKNDDADQILEWATRQVDRRKLSALTTTGAVDQIGESFVALTNEDALANFGELQFVTGEGEFEPESTVEVTLSGTASPLEWDGDSLAYQYTYDDNGQSHNVWLGSEATLAHRTQLVAPYNLRGLAVLGLAGVEDGTGFAAALDSFQNGGEAPQPSGAAIVWTVRDGEDSVLASESGSDLTFSWDTGPAEGDYTIQADFALGDNVATLGTIDVVVATAEAEEEVAEAEADATTDETSEATAANVGFTGDADAVVNVGANLRTGPGLTYGIVSGGANPGTQLKLLGRNSDSSWYFIMLPDGTEAWIFAQLVTVNQDFNLSSLEVVEAPPPAPAAAGGGGNSSGESPAAAPPPPVTAPTVTNAGFELGGQTHTLANPQLMQYAGMNWVKFQHKWGPGGNPEDLAGRINQAQANGFKVLLSIPGSPYPSSIDFEEYVRFLGGVAALGPNAIEVWNEMNIDFEWPAGQINPQSYVTNMLAPAYNAIKRANPNVMVISGAPAPTGFFGGGCSTNGCDDSAYLAGMAAAGAASYMDCMGAHFNAGATPPSQSTGHPSGNDHYSWHFQPMVDLYYGTLGKPVCFTELGYLSGDDYGGVPPRFSWAGGTSVSEHAAWLAQAVSQAAASGKVRMVIVFNVDFTQWGDDPQAGYAMIRADGSCPACETLRQVMGR